MKHGRDQRKIRLEEPAFLRFAFLATCLLYVSFLTSFIAIGAENYFYSEGVCYKSNGRPSSNHEACGFVLGKADRYEWDIVEDECKKIDVYVSKLNPEWELRKLRKYERYSLKSCGYSVSNDHEGSRLNRLSSGSCKKDILIVSHYGLEDRILPNRSPANNRDCEKNKELVRHKQAPVQNPSVRRPSSFSASSKLTGQTSTGLKSRRK